MDSRRVHLPREAGPKGLEEGQVKKITVSKTS